MSGIIRSRKASAVLHNPAAWPSKSNRADWAIIEAARGKSVLRFVDPADWQGVASGSLAADVTAEIQAALNDAAGAPGQGRRVVWLPEGRHGITGLTVPSRVIFEGPGELYPMGASAVALKLENTLYSEVNGISININAANQKALQLLGTGGSYSQLCTFNGIKIDSDTLPAGTVGVEINNSFSNDFHSAKVLRVATGVTFANEANANHFWGGELRSNNTLANCANPFVHGSGCEANAFHGTIIENWRLPGLMNGGSLTIEGEAYIEAFASAAAIEMNAGHLKLLGNYLNNGFIFINGGECLTLRDNRFDGALSNAGYPFVRYNADVATRLIDSGNVVVNAAGVLKQPRQWWNGASFAYRSIGNRNETSDQKTVRFQSRLAADVLNVTGDGTEYQIVWGGNEQFDDGSNVGATFTAPENGVYHLEAAVYVSGIVTADHNNLQIKIVTTNRSYVVSLEGVDGVQSTGGQIVRRGTCLADMEAGETAYVTVLVSGASKVVDVLRGDAQNGYTTFSGVKIG